MAISSAEASAQENREKLERLNRERLRKFEEGLQKLDNLNDMGGDLVDKDTYVKHCNEELQGLMHGLQAKVSKQRRGGQGE